MCVFTCKCGKTVSAIFNGKKTENRCWKCIAKASKKAKKRNIQQDEL